MPTAYRAEFGNVSCGAGCGGLRCALVVLVRFVADRAVGCHAGCCSLLHEMLGKEEPVGMFVIDFSMRAAPWCGACSGPGQGTNSSYGSEIARKTQPPRTNGHISSLVGGAESGQREGVHNVHTLGFGSSCTGAGLARTGDVFGGVAEIQRLEPGSSPTSGTVFSAGQGPFWCFFVCTSCTLSPLI